jgi:hypothetical protein
MTYRFQLLQQYLIVFAKRRSYALETMHPLLPFRTLATDIKHVYSVEMDQGVSTRYPEHGDEPE